MTSLRGRLLASILALLTAYSLVAGFAAYFLDRAKVDELLDGQLRQMALNIGDIRTTAVPAGGAPSEPEDMFVVSIWSADGAFHTDDDQVSFARPALTGFDAVTASGEAWRTYAMVEPSRTVQVAQRIAVRREFAVGSALRAVLPVLAILPFSWALVGWIVARVLRPTREIAAELSRRDHLNASDPLPLSELPDEIVPLVAAMDGLVGRLRDQIEFRARFISDAAHELRTPLTALRLQAAGLRSATETPEARATAAEMEIGLRRMSGAISQLLDLARSESPAAGICLGPVHLGEAIAAATEGVIQLATAKGVDLGLVSPVDEWVVGETPQIGTLITNLLENAIRHTPENGTVDLEVSRADGWVVLEVRDTGPGVPEPLLERIGERFFRVEPKQDDGSGLGLAIVKAIAARFGGLVRFSNRSDRGGLVVSVRFKAAPPQFGRAG